MYARAPRLASPHPPRRRSLLLVSETVRENEPPVPLKPGSLVRADSDRRSDNWAATLRAGVEVQPGVHDRILLTTCRTVSRPQASRASLRSRISCRRDSSTAAAR